MDSSDSLTRRRRLLWALERRIASIEQRISDLERTITDAYVREAPVAPAERVLCAAMRTRKLLLTHCDAARAALDQDTAGTPGDEPS